MRHLITGSAEELEILKEFPKGTLEEERAFHKRFQRSHIIREWFRYDPEIAIYLGDLSDFDRMNLFRVRMLENEELTNASRGSLSVWLHAMVELCYYRGGRELQEFLDTSKSDVDMKRPLDDAEVRYLTNKRWALYAKKAN